MTSFSVLVCEPQPIVVEGLEKIFNEAGDFQFVGAARIGDVQQRAIEVQPDLLLLDESAGLHAILQIVGTLRPLAERCRPALWVMQMSEAEAFRAVQSGLRGVIRKDLSITRLLEALREIANGRVWIEASNSSQPMPRKSSARLTPREREVVALVCKGLKNKEIASQLQITPGTVKVHLMHIFEKTGWKDRLALAVHERDIPEAEEPSFNSFVNGVD